MARRYAALPVDPTDTDPTWAELTCGEQSLYVTLVRDSTMTQAGELGVTLRAWSLQAADRTPETVKHDLDGLVQRGYVAVDWDRERLLVLGHLSADGSLGNPKHAGGALSAIEKLKSPLLRGFLSLDMHGIEDAAIAPAKRAEFRTLQAFMEAEGAPLAYAAIGNRIGNRTATPQPVTSNHEPVTTNHETPPEGSGAAAPAPVVETVRVSAPVEYPDPFADDELDLDLPEPVNGKSAEDQGEATVGSLTGVYVTLYKATHDDKRPTSDLIARMGKAIKQALKDGTDGADIEAALRLLVARPRCGPSTLSGFIAEATSTVVAPARRGATGTAGAGDRRAAEKRALDRLLGNCAETGDRPNLTVVQSSPKEISA